MYGSMTLPPSSEGAVGIILFAGTAASVAQAAILAVVDGAPVSSSEPAPLTLMRLRLQCNVDLQPMNEQHGNGVHNPQANTHLGLSDLGEALGSLLELAKAYVHRTPSSCKPTRHHNWYPVFCRRSR